MTSAETWIRLTGLSLNALEEGDPIGSFARSLFGVIALTLVVAGSLPAAAVTFGEPDVTGRYPNVGMMVVEFEGELFPACSGTLVDEDIFLTAGHCTSFAEADALPTFVSFDPAFDPDGIFLPGTPVTDPRFGHDLGDLFDVGVIVLDRPVGGIEPAPLAPVGSLPGLGVRLRSDTFTAVGYGAERHIKEGGPHGIEGGGTRMIATQHVLSLTKAWVTFNQNPATGGEGTCFGDSGGPHFNLEGQIVAVTSRGDSMCRATDKSYRIDTAQARAFIDTFVT